MQIFKRIEKTLNVYFWFDDSRVSILTTKTFETRMTRQCIQPLPFVIQQFLCRIRQANDFNITRQVKIVIFGNIQFHTIKISNTGNTDQGQNFLKHPRIIFVKQYCRYCSFNNWTCQCSNREIRTARRAWLMKLCYKQRRIISLNRE